VYRKPPAHAIETGPVRAFPSPKFTQAPLYSPNPIVLLVPSEMSDRRTFDSQ